MYENVSVRDKGYGECEGCVWEGFVRPLFGGVTVVKRSLSSTPTGTTAGVTIITSGAFGARCLPC